MNKSIILGIMMILCTAHNNAMDSKKTAITQSRKSSVSKPFSSLKKKKKIPIVNTTLIKESVAPSYAHFLHPMATIRASLPAAIATYVADSTTLPLPATSLVLPTISGIDISFANPPIQTPSLPQDISQNIAMSAKQKEIFIGDAQKRIDNIEEMLEELNLNRQRRDPVFCFGAYNLAIKNLTAHKQQESHYINWLTNEIPTSSQEGIMPHLSVAQVKAFIEYLKQQPESCDNVEIEGPLVEDERPL